MLRGGVQGPGVDRSATPARRTRAAYGYAAAAGEGGRFVSAPPGRAERLRVRRRSRARAKDSSPPRLGRAAAGQSAIYGGTTSGAPCARGGAAGSL
jgi:hypothetical protein